MHGAFAFQDVSHLLDGLAMGLFAIAPVNIRNTFTQTFIAPDGFGVARAVRETRHAASFAIVRRIILEF